MPAPLFVRFLGGSAGQWRVVRSHTLRGAALADVPYVRLHEGSEPLPFGEDRAWELRGVTSHHRYVERAEGEALRRLQEGLARPAATCAALIPIRKNDAWWALAQDERRAVFEERSRHIADT